MIRLFLNPVTENVLGYELIKKEDARSGDIAIEETEENLILLRCGMIAGNLYFKSGELTEGEVDACRKEWMEKKIEFSTAQKLVNEEQKTFMNNVLSGMSTEAAVAVTAENRRKFEANKKACEDFAKKIKKEMLEAAAAKHQITEKDMEWDHYASVCLLIRDEDRYLDEWIRWHLEQGFDHIYIYDNGVNETVTDVITEDVADKIKVIDWHGPFGNVQEHAYNHFLKNHAAETRWVIFVDSDEFVRMADGDLKSFLAENEAYTMIKVGFVEYNANGLESCSDEPVRERFTETVNICDEIYHKDFIQPHRVDYMDRHYPRFSQNGNYTLDRPEGVIVDHYYTKSWEEWCRKIRERGSCDPGYRKRLNEFFIYNPDMKYLDEGENSVQSYTQT